MTWSVPPDDAAAREFALLLAAHHPLIVCECDEEDRVMSLLDAAALRLRFPVFAWRAHLGLSKADDERPIVGTEDAALCVAFIDGANREAVYHLRGFGEALRDSRVISRLKEVCRKFQQHRGAVVLSGAEIELPASLATYATFFEVPPPSPQEYRDVIQGVIHQLGATHSIAIDLSQEKIRTLYTTLRGLSLSETRRLIARAVMRDGVLSEEDFEEIRRAKREALERTGTLALVAESVDLSRVAGLSAFKAWVRKRTRAFRDPSAAKAVGLTPARGVLLTGVQGCGKSLAAKAVAGEWQLPVVRLDPATLFSKYVGETERALRRTLTRVEAMAPLVLWIDEIEKAFSQSSDNDGGVSQRLLGSFLAWLQEHRAPVFVVATANDISALPPELLRKGRFDELFFVDLPEEDVRRELFTLHLATKGLSFDSAVLGDLARQSEGFGGAEIEQAIVAALHAAFSAQVDLTPELVLAELHATTPLSVTMAEGVAALRRWAQGRAVRADEPREMPD